MIKMILEFLSVFKIEKRRKLLLLFTVIFFIHIADGQICNLPNSSINLFLDVQPSSFNRVKLDTVRASCNGDETVKLKVLGFDIKVKDDTGSLIFTSFENGNILSDSTKKFFLHLKNEIEDGEYYKLWISSSKFLCPDSTIVDSSITISYKIGNNLFIPPIEPITE